MFNMTQTTAAALTGFPCIDPYATVSHGLLDRQNSMASQISNGGPKYMGHANMQTPMNGNAPSSGGRVSRGAAGMRSAGFQAMVNNTLRHTAASRRKFSEQFLYDYIVNQQQASLQQHQVIAQQQALVAPPAGVVIIPNGPGVPLWRPAVSSATSGYMPVIPTPPFTIPIAAQMPATSISVPVSLVSEPVPTSVAVSMAVPVSAPPAITTVADSEESPPPAAQQVAQTTTLLPTGQLIFNGNNGAVPFTSYQQHLEDFCRDHGFGTPQYERSTIQHKDASGRDVLLYNYKITIPGLVHTHGSFQLAKVWPSEMEAREAAAQFVFVQLGVLLTPANASIIGTGYDILGMPQMSPTSPWFIPDVPNSFFAINPLYQQQLRRPINQPLNITAASPPPATA